jgi:hypothetical protein
MTPVSFVAIVRLNGEEKWGQEMCDDDGDGDTDGGGG